MKRIVAILAMLIMMACGCYAEGMQNLSKQDVIGMCQTIAAQAEATPEKITPALLMRTYLELKEVVLYQEHGIMQNIAQMSLTVANKDAIDGLMMAYKPILTDWQSLMGNADAVWEKWLADEITDEECGALMMDWIRSVAEMK